MFNKDILKFFWHHVKPYKWHYLAMMAAPTVTSFYSFAYNYSIKLFLDLIASDTGLSYSAGIYPILIFIGAQIALDLVWRISNIIEWRSEPYVRRSILMESYDYVQNHSYSYFQNNLVGAISSKLKGLLDGYEKFWAEIHQGMLIKILKILINLIALFFVNFYLGIFVFGWALIYSPIVYCMSKKLNAFAFEETESRHTIVGSLSDKITNMFSIFNFSGKDFELSKLRKLINADFIPKQMKLYKYAFKLQVVGGVLYKFMFAFILFYMLYLTMNNLISIGDFAFVFGLTLIIAEDIWATTNSIQEFARAMGDLKSALMLMAIPHENCDMQDAKKLLITRPTIEFKEVCFGYSDNYKVINNFNLSIKAGEKIGLVGFSGAGKSTIVNLLLRYFTRDSGKILIDAQDINVIYKSSLREQISVIPQDTMLFHRSILENIRYGNLMATDEQVIEASKKAHIHDHIMSLPEQYNSYVGERGINLSGGQRQRIAIARAILKQSKILILDEATSALDSKTEKIIQKSLNYLIEQRDTTVIAVAHRLSTLKHMDRVIILDKGKIIEQGSHDQLVAKQGGTYKEMWDLQFS